MSNIAIVGHGFVGKAVAHAFKNCVYAIDPKLNNDISYIYNENIDGDHIEFIFVCLPTPMLDNGEIDSSIVDKCVNNLLENTDAIIIIKSTLTPDKINKNKRVVYNPEFLTEKNANEDFINAKLHILGGDSKNCCKVFEIYQKYSIVKARHNFLFTTKKEASIIKYGINSFLATKVTFFNQLYDLVDANNCDYETVLKAMLYDDRIAFGHTQVADKEYSNSEPRKRGFGGACLPKDVNAIYHFSNKKFTLLKEIQKINKKYRKNYPTDEREINNNIKFD